MLQAISPAIRSKIPVSTTGRGWRLPHVGNWWRISHYAIRVSDSPTVATTSKRIVVAALKRRPRTKEYVTNPLSASENKERDATRVIPGSPRLQSWLARRDRKPLSGGSGVPSLYGRLPYRGDRDRTGTEWGSCLTGPG